MGWIQRKVCFIPQGSLNLPLVGTACLLFVISGFIVSFINCERCGRLVYIFEKGHVGQQVERTLKSYFVSLPVSALCEKHRS